MLGTITKAKGDSIMTTSKKWVTICVAVGLIAACTLAAPPGAGAAITETKDSADFDWKYEMQTEGPYPMDVKPSDQDLDANGTMDFHEGGTGGSSSVSDGILTMASNNTQARYFRSNIDLEIWRNQNFTFAEGYTIECSVKVNSSTGEHGAFAIFSESLGTGGDAQARLLIHDDSQEWGSHNLGNYIDLGENDNTEDFHVFRIAQEAGQDNFGVWRDGTLLYEGTRAGTYDEDILLFGDPGGGWGGEVEVDYFRFIKGAYAPEGGSPPPIPGDANLDNIVNDADASILAAHWQQTGMSWGDGDFNNDQIVNDADASILAAHWQETQEGAAAVPEPSALALLFGAGLIVLFARARRRR